MQSLVSVLHVLCLVVHLSMSNGLVVWCFGTGGHREGPFVKMLLQQSALETVGDHELIVA